MRTQPTILHNASKTSEMTEPVFGRQPVLTLLTRLLWAAAFVLPVFGAHAAVVFTTLYSFQVFPDGANPTAALVPGSDGNFYGTTSGVNPNGHPYCNGTVFKITTNGALTTLYSFSGDDGAYPFAGLVRGSDGYLYGTTFGGGVNGSGTVFKISTNGVLTTLHSFGGNDGAYPVATLVPGSDGYFYGTTRYGGTNYYFGTVFKISTNGALTTLYAFGTVTNASGAALDGADPQAGLVPGSDGNFYGTTQYGGTNGLSFGGYGTVFKISPEGALTTLYSFGSISDANGYLIDGANPTAGLVQGRDGYFYGTTFDGGTNGDNGTVFKVSPNGAFTSLHSFGFVGSGNDGSGPRAGLVQGRDGYFYGTTEYGGTGSFGPYSAGTVFKISTNGALTTLYSFGSILAGLIGLPLDGAFPAAGLVQGRDGYFYGTTYAGGTNYGDGTVFKISATGALTRLYSFGFNDGASPSAALVQGSDSSFYGTTEGGGRNGWFGTVFKVSTNGALTSLYSFGSVQDTNGFPLDGANPSAALVQGSDGYFYGTTLYGGTSGWLEGQNSSFGTVFKISTNGVLTILHSFGTISDANGNLIDGAIPNGLVQGSDGNFYGTTYYGGTNGAGTVFKVSTNGVLTTLYSFAGTMQFFNGTSDGANPSAGLVQGSDGNFYGTTEYGGTNFYWNGYYNSSSGTLFRISTNGVLTTLYSFGSILDANGHPLDGANPTAALVQGSDGNFYGTTQYFGTNNAGTVFEISPNGALARSYSFTGTNDGAYPNGLVQGSDGNFYGATYGGGTSPGYLGYGTVFKISTNEPLTTLYSFFNGGGIHPNGLVQGSDGNFYGTTEWNGDEPFYGGGYYGGGTVFRLTIVPEPPTISCSTPLILECQNGAAVATVRAEVQDTNGNPLQLVWTVDRTASQTNNIPSGGLLTASNVAFTATFGLGEHVVVVSASNGQTDPVTCSITVTVRHTTPPQILSVVATPNVLWPPNHRMIPVNLTVDAVDNCDSSPVVKITKVTSNEPQNPSAPDWQITGPPSLNLRAERLGKGQGRIYTIVVECKDVSGNVSTASVDVTVPHN